MSPERQMRFWLVGLLLTVGALYLLSDILLPFVAGMAVAYFFDPVCDRMERAGLNRVMATSLVTGLAALMFLLVIGLLVPAALGQVAALSERLPELIVLLRGKLEGAIALLEAKVDPEMAEKMKAAAFGSLGDVAGVVTRAITGLLSGGLAVINLLSLVFLTPVVTFFMLRDWDHLVARIDGWLPRAHAETIRELARETDEILAGFVRGVASVCLVLAAFYCISLTLIGLESALVVGLTAGLISFVPFVGAIGGLVIGVGLALLQFDSYLTVGAVAAVFVVGQALEGNYLTPKLVGGKVGLHPVVVIFALLAGGALFGFTGVLLSMPVAAVLGVGVRFALARYLASPLYGAPAGDDRDAPDGDAKDNADGDT